MRYLGTPLEGLKLRRLAALSISEHAEHLEFLHVAVELQNGTATLENSLMVSYKFKHTPYNPAILLLGIFQEK